MFGPRFEPLDDSALYGIGDVADGRLQKYLGSVNGLADQRRADRIAVAIDQTAVGLVGEDNLRDSRYNQGVDDAGQNAEDNYEQQRMLV